MRWVSGYFRRPKRTPLNHPRTEWVDPYLRSEATSNYPQNGWEINNISPPYNNSPYYPDYSYYPTVSEKSWSVALLLSVFLGSLGADRFYLGYAGLGTIKLLTLGGCGIWALFDVILIAINKLPDAQGRILRK